MAPRADGNRPSSSSPDRLTEALEATCEALFALQLIQALAPDDGPLKAYVVRAIESLRRAIAELRTVRGQPPSFYACGFVIASPADGTVSLEPGTDQSRP